MVNSFVTLKGELYYARTITPETDPWGNTNYKVTLYPDAESLSTIMELQTQGFRNTLKKDDKGYNITYKRAHSKQTKKGEWVLGPPKVYDADGKTEIKEMIGNGSKGQVKLEIYPYSFQGRASKALRLEAIKVDTLVPYSSGVETEAPQSASTGW
jgi:hypothetical protein